MSRQKQNDPPLSFEQAARELGTDESLERFNEVLGKVARHKPAEPSKKLKKEGQAGDVGGDR